MGLCFKLIVLLNNYFEIILGFPVNQIFRVKKTIGMMIVYDSETHEA